MVGVLVKAQEYKNTEIIMGVTTKEAMFVSVWLQNRKKM